MSWVAVAVGVGSAVVGGVSANKQAKAANKSKTTTTNQTDTRTPFLYDAIAPDIGEVLARQRGLAAQGTPQVGPNGQIYYAGAPRAGAPGAGGEGFAGVGTQGAAKSAKDAAWKSFLASGGNKNDQAAWKSFQKSGAGSSSGPVGPKTAGPAPKSAADIFREAAQRGFDAGDTATMTQGRNAVGNILGAAGRGGSAAEGEETGFEGYNPILDNMARELGIDLSQRGARDLLMKFIGADGAGGGFGGGFGTSGFGGGASSGNPRRSQTYEAPAYIQQMGGGGGRGSTTVGGVPVPDAAGTGLFGTEVRKFFDEPANQAELEALIDATNKDTERSSFRDLAQLNAAAQSGGRFGGDMWKGMSSDARRAALDAMTKTAAGVRVGDRDARRNAALAALGQVNTRDLGSLQAQTQLEIAARNAAAAGAGSAEAAALARRGQDLQALGMLFNNEQFNTGQLSDIGQRLSSDRLGSVGLIPGLEGVNLSGLGIANAAGGGLVNLEQIAAQDAASRRSAGIARQGMNQQLGMFNAQQGQQGINDYLGTLLRIGGMGGTSTTQGTNVIPGAGINANAAGAMGAVGGFMSGYGAMSGMGFGAGAGASPAASSVPVTGAGSGLRW